MIDHDYATEVVQRRKTYTETKKILKENGIRFLTPLTRIRIHWTDGPQLYNSTTEAAKEMRKRGTEIHVKEADQGRTVEERTQAASRWQRTGGLTQRLKEKLVKFWRTGDTEDT